VIAGREVDRSRPQFQSLSKPEARGRLWGSRLASSSQRDGLNQRVERPVRKWTSSVKPRRRSGIALGQTAAGKWVTPAIAFDVRLLKLATRTPFWLAAFFNPLAPMNVRVTRSLELEPDRREKPLASSSPVFLNFTAFCASLLSLSLAAIGPQSRERESRSAP